MTHDRVLPRSSSKISLSATDSPKRDNRFSWLLYLWS